MERRFSNLLGQGFSVEEGDSGVEVLEPECIHSPVGERCTGS